jgi:hypothetical protein
MSVIAFHEYPNDIYYDIHGNRDLNIFIIIRFSENPRILNAFI